MCEEHPIFRNNFLNFILMLNLALVFPSGNTSPRDFMWKYFFLADFPGELYFLKCLVWLI